MEGVMEKSGWCLRARKNDMRQTVVNASAANATASHTISRVRWGVLMAKVSVTSGKQHTAGWGSR